MNTAVYYGKSQMKSAELFRDEWGWVNQIIGIYWFA